MINLIFRIMILAFTLTGYILLLKHSQYDYAILYFWLMYIQIFGINIKFEFKRKPNHCKGCKYYNKKCIRGIIKSELTVYNGKYGCYENKRSE